MDIDLMNYANTSIVSALVLVGAFIKHNKLTAKIPNNYIPYILVVLGIIGSIIVNGVNLNSCICGVVSGISAVGLHQTGKITTQFIKASDNGVDEDE